jgi:hypothetical protein
MWAQQSRWIVETLKSRIQKKRDRRLILRQIVARVEK